MATGTEALNYSLTISGSGNINYTYSESKDLASQDVLMQSQITVKNDSVWNELPLGGGDYLTFLFIETTSPVQLVLNSTTNDVIYVEKTFHSTFGVNQITTAYVKNDGSELARITYIPSGKLAT